MAQMAVAPGAANLYTAHAVGGIFVRHHRLSGNGGEEAGPAGAALELRVGAEQGQVAAGAPAAAVPPRVARRGAGAAGVDRLWRC